MPYAWIVLPFLVWISGDVRAETPPPLPATPAAGERVLFMEDFSAAREGELPGKWQLLNGAGSARKVKSQWVLALTDGAYAQAEPKLAGPPGASLRLEFGFYPATGGSEVATVFLNPNTDDEMQINFGRQVWILNLSTEARATYPPALDPEGPQFGDQWHHGVVLYERGKLTCYLDQYRLLTGISTEGRNVRSIALGGIVNPEQPLLLKGVRISTR